MADNSSSNQSIERMFRIIESMAPSDKPLRLNEISEKSGVPASTAMRILNAMIQNGYASQDADTMLYSLSYKFLEISTAIRENLSLNQELRPYLQEISRKMQLSCALGIQNQYCITYIDEVISMQQMIRIYHHLGVQYPLHKNACGKLFLSQFSPEELTRYLQQADLSVSTPKTLSSREELEENLEQIRTQGYAVNDEESMLGMRCIALPLIDPDGEIFAGVSISGTVYQLPHDTIPTLVQTTRRILKRFYDECNPLLKNVHRAELF